MAYCNTLSKYRTLQHQTRGGSQFDSPLFANLLGTDFPVPPGMANRIAKFHRRAENELMFKEGQRVRANLAGMQAGGVLFHAAVTDAVGNVVRQTSENPPVYLVRLLFSFKGVNEVEVPAERITAF